MQNNAILVVGPSWVGDMVMAQTLFKVLKQQQPHRAIDLLAPAWSAPLAARMPEIRAAIAMPVGHGELRLGLRHALGKQLRAQKYNQAIVLPNSFKSALVPVFANIPKRTSWRGEMRYGFINDMRLLDKVKYPKMIDRFAALAYPKDHLLPEKLPLPEFSIDRTVLATTLTNYNLSTEQPVLALCPGAEFGPAKRWPSEHYAKVAQAYLARGWQVWLFGSTNDAPVADTIMQLTGKQCVDLTGKTQLSQAIDLLSVASLVISNDSGLMHISAALQRPMVVIYGSTDPGFTPPLLENVKIVSLGLACSPCFERECPLGHLKCLHDLMPEKVLAATALLEKAVVASDSPSTCG